MGGTGRGAGPQSIRNDIYFILPSSLQAFIGMIVLPIAGNACEHVAAVVVAMKNKMELSLGIALGSSLQISLCVLPFVVLVGWATGHPMGLDLDLFIVVALVSSSALGPLASAAACAAR